MRFNAFCTRWYKMGNRIENLGDYNRVRLDLQAKGGDLNALYDEIRRTAVAEATPKLIFKGCAIASFICGTVFFIPKAIRFIKERNEKINNEPVLKKQFVEMLQTDYTIQDNEKCLDDEVKK